MAASAAVAPSCQRRSLRAFSSQTMAGRTRRSGRVVSPFRWKWGGAAALLLPMPPAPRGYQFALVFTCKQGRLPNKLCTVLSIVLFVPMLRILASSAFVSVKIRRIAPAAGGAYKGALVTDPRGNDITSVAAGSSRPGTEGLKETERAFILY